MQSTLAKVATALALMTTHDLSGQAQAAHLGAGVQDGFVKIPIEKVAYTLTQVSSYAQLSAKAGQWAGSDGSVKMALDNAYNFGYIGEFYLGSGAGQTRIRTMLDTGSANSWIVSKESVQKRRPEERSKFNAFDKSLSPTYREPAEDDKQYTKISFGSGSLRGYFAHDQCTLGSLDDPSNQLVLDDYMFGLVLEENTF